MVTSILSIVISILGVSIADYYLHIKKMAVDRTFNNFKIIEAYVNDMINMQKSKNVIINLCRTKDIIKSENKDEKNNEYKVLKNKEFNKLLKINDKTSNESKKMMLEQYSLFKNMFVLNRRIKFFKKRIIGNNFMLTKFINFYDINHEITTILDKRKKKSVFGTFLVEIRIVNYKKNEFEILLRNKLYDPTLKKNSAWKFKTSFSTDNPKQEIEIQYLENDEPKYHTPKTPWDEFLGNNNEVSLSTLKNKIRKDKKLRENRNNDHKKLFIQIIIYLVLSLLIRS